MPELTIGAHLHSQVCPAEVIVVRAPTSAVQVECGGAEMSADAGVHPKSAAAAGGPGTLLGKRYTDEASGLELLCVKPGTGTLSVAGRPLPQKLAKQLPASD